MTALEKFIYERSRISLALRNAGISNVMLNKDDIPKTLPCAILILDSEAGKNGTSRQYVSTDLAWTVFLIVNAHNAPDPDNDLYLLKEGFRKFYISLINRDFPSVEYYTSRIDGTRLVRIAKIDLLKSGTRVAS
ncbi:hypothetical protein MASR2M64_07510 [Candidatus Cloacimonadota bacterium]|jgi:hypothetical protein